MKDKIIWTFVEISESEQKKINGITNIVRTNLKERHYLQMLLGLDEFHQMKVHEIECES